jgi:ubiquinone/menaquinone biosynthesis C-methylase UbiE
MSSLSRKTTLSRTLWEKKQKQNAYWYVSSYGPYDADRNLEEFWASGTRIWGDLKGAIGYRPCNTDRVVDIGCGVGRLTRAIAKDVISIDAFDISDEMLSLAQERGPTSVSFRLAEGFSLKPLEDHCAGLVLGYCVFQHLPHLDAVDVYMKEMVQVSKK